MKFFYFKLLPLQVGKLLFLNGIFGIGNDGAELFLELGKA